jgi:glycerophosphoryl diester phosphodiesterase
MPSPLIIAHRGASFDAPENTLAAYRLAWEQNADGAEGDFHLTRDGEIVCIHDAATGRTADANLVVAQATLAELRALDFGIWKHRRFAGERIATLGEILQLLPAKKLFFIEIKCGVEILAPLRVLLDRSDVRPEQLRLICFNSAVIEEASLILPRIKRHWLVEYSIDSVTGEMTPTPQVILQTLGQIEASGLNSQANLDVLSANFVGELASRDYETAAWTVDDPAVARSLLQVGVQMLTTNRPGWLGEQLGGGQ